MKYLNGLQQAGDTIVEVLIAISIISVVLVGAYAATNRNTANNQDAQERSQAVQLVQSQIEALRQASQSKAPNAMPVSGGCFTDDGSPAMHANPPAPDPCGQSKNGSVAYELSITSDAPDHVCKVGFTCTISATWQSIDGPYQDNITMYYRPPVAPS